MADFENDEGARLHEIKRDSSTPLWEHNALWVRIPALAIRAAQLSLLAFGVHGKLLASFWVLIFIAYGVVWKPGAWFLVLWAALCFIGFSLGFNIDQMSRRRSDNRRMWMTHASILPILVCSSPYFLYLFYARSKIH